MDGTAAAAAAVLLAVMKGPYRRTYMRKCTSTARSPAHCTPASFLQRLHKYATYNSRPVFGQYSNDAAKILQAAAANEQG